jgi:hypothetical protein
MEDAVKDYLVWNGVTTVTLCHGEDPPVQLPRAEECAPAGGLYDGDGVRGYTLIFTEVRAALTEMTHSLADPTGPLPAVCDAPGAADQQTTRRAGLKLPD